MSASVATAPMSYVFDDRHIRWFALGDFKHFVFAMLAVDVPRKIVDFVLKFPPNEKIFLHRHLALTDTIVIQGEHRLYEPTGQLKEVRPVGCDSKCGAFRQPLGCCAPLPILVPVPICSNHA